MYELWDHEGVRAHKIGELLGWSVEESQSSPETRLHCSALFCGIFMCYTGRGILPDSLCPTDSLEKTLMLGKIEGRRKKRGWDGWMASPTWWTWVWAHSRRWWRTELHYKENWALKNWCFWTLVLEKTLESPLDSKEIQPVHPKGNQSWIFIRRTDAEAETPVLWPPLAKNWLIGKTLMLGKMGGRRRRGW